MRRLVLQRGVVVVRRDAIARGLCLLCVGHCPLSAKPCVCWLLLLPLLVLPRCRLRLLLLLLLVLWQRQLYMLLRLQPRRTALCLALSIPNLPLHSAP